MASNPLDAPSPSTGAHPMTPEERAREISCAVSVDADGVLMFDGQDNNAEQLIADAIADALRDARNEALEEAAKVADEWHAKKGALIATTIRALITEDEKV